MSRRLVRRMPRVSIRELHFTRSFCRQFRASLSEPICRMVICSPYFGSLPSPFEDILHFCVMQKRRGVEDLQIITRPPGADNTALPADVARELAHQGISLYVRVAPYLHAKFYHFDYMRGNFRSFVGSSNFTVGGFLRNSELVAEIEGVGTESPCHREIAGMRDKGALPYETWVGRGCPGGEEETP